MSGCTIDSIKAMGKLSSGKVAEQQAAEWAPATGQGRNANIFFYHASTNPKPGAPHTINALLEEALEEFGYNLSSISYVETIQDKTTQNGLSFAMKEARRLANLTSNAVDLALYCDGGVQICPPSKKNARHNVIFFHGMARNVGIWSSNTDVDLYLANSLYLAEVLQGLLAMPRWQNGWRIDARTYYSVKSIRLGLPWLSTSCLDQDDRKALSQLPPAVEQAMKEDVLLGHSLQPGKSDKFAHLEIMLYLSRVSAEQGRKARLLVTEVDLASLETYLLDPTNPWALRLHDQLKQEGLRLKDLLIPMPRLPRKQLFRIFQSCTFGLSYNVVPEAFGIYVLESVFHGCPVYTNGSGNMRHVLPENNGINVIESEAMVFGARKGYNEVGDRIVHDSTVGRDTIKKACARGRDFIMKNYCHDTMMKDLSACLSSLEHKEQASIKTLDSEQLTIRLGPLVRSWNHLSGAIISDLANEVLPPHKHALIHGILGRKADDVITALGTTDLALVDELFCAGILALVPGD
ncbi:MAG: glycosyltransferase [Cyanobacteria bacterium K_Offshore_surface_m2_239]|nr:glycosyltransferase [Cyanobacteria bacterium K_Offshore_surface_m2_239]